MTGKVQPREGLALYSLSDISSKEELKIDFESIRPKTASEKCSDMLATLVYQSTKTSHRVLDAFAGT